MNSENKWQSYGCVWRKGRIFTFLLLCNGALMFSAVDCWTYHYSDETMPYELARKYCQSNYTDLVAIQNKREIDYLVTNIPFNPTYYWIGIRKINNIWTWVGTNKTLTDEAKNWGKGEPNNKKNKEDCVEIYIKRPKDSGKWNDDACSKKKRALCYTASCDQSSCSGHGECIETINNYTCDCAPGFYGPECQYVVQCQHLSALSQGYMNCSHPWGNFSFQSSCLYGCFHGFVLNGTDRSQCLSSGEWNSAEPHCTASCDQSSCSGHGECIETINNYTCDCAPGFNGPECQYVVQCQHLSALSQGYMNCSHPWGNFSFQSSCLFGCFHGFVLNGTDRSQCLSSGKWSSAEPHCTAVTCGALDSPLQGSFACSHPWAKNSYGSTCVFTCSEGWKLNGSDVTTCESTGQWTENIPKCEAQEKFVYHPDEHTNAVFMIGLATAISALSLAMVFWFIIRRLKKDKKKTSTWKHFYHPHPPHTQYMRKASVIRTHSILALREELVCEDCFKMDPVPRQVVGSKVVGKQTSLQLLCLAALSFGFLKTAQVSGWTYNYTIEAQTWNDSYDWCRRHFTDMVAIQNKEEISYLTQYLRKDGIYYWVGLRKRNDIWVWIGTNKSLTKDEENWAKNEPNNKKRNEDCVEMYIQRDTDNGKWNDIRCTAKKRALCYLVSCNESSCNKHGDCMETVENYTCKCWPGFYGANCENAMSCSALDDPSHGQMNCSHVFEEYRFESICKFTCEEGFQLRGSNSLLCQHSGEWSEPIPKCTAVPCIALQSPEHGEVNCSHAFGEYRYKSICNITCDQGFELEGSPSLFCQNTGEWSESTPSCLAVSCRSLQSPSHGNMICSDTFGTFQYNSVCNFSCDEGFELTGTKSLTCQNKGEWSESIPTCKAVPCKTLQSPENGKVNCSDEFGEYRYKSICNVTCEEGFELQGSPSFLCQNTGEWSESISACVAEEVHPERQKQAHTGAYVLTSLGLMLAGMLTAYAIKYYRKKRKDNPELLKIDKVNTGAFENPVFNGKENPGFQKTDKDSANTFENPAFEGKNNLELLKIDKVNNGTFENPLFKGIENPGFLKTDKDSANTFENPAFEDNERSRDP
ncbi:P-selectin-like [Eleutherodactylus coqui]|uniref:P-selectin-like n=1 Tax=Eleutherodactylus coqui TaxID=57060 RepID=UPI003462D776